MLGKEYSDSIKDNQNKKEVYMTRTNLLKEL